MGRTKVNLPKEKLVKTIKEVEKDGPLKNRSELAEFVGDRLGVTGSIVLLRLKEYKIEPKTPKGKRGRQPGEKIPRGNRTTRKEKFSSNEAKKAINELISSIPQEYRKKTEYKSLVKRMKNGSMDAIIKLKCLDCCCHQKSEIRNCRILSCPLFLIRGYK